MQTFEQQVFTPVILHLDSSTKLSDMATWPLWKGPAQQYSVPLQSEVVMEARCMMLFHGVGTLAMSVTAGFSFHFAAYSSQINRASDHLYIASPK